MPRGNTAAVVHTNGASKADSYTREFTFSDADFRMLAQFAHDKAGIALSDAKRNLVYGRLSRRLRALGLKSFSAYREYLLSDPSEVQRFINAISTNLTKFFREIHHFKHFQKNIAVPFRGRLLQDREARLRVWSAGCSTGEEPYSLAAILDHAIPNAAHSNVRVLATDVDTDVLATGSRGEYSEDSLEDVPAAYRYIFSESANGKGGAKLLVAEAVRALVCFKKLNLIAPWPIRGKFDAIFCRNVMIYFDPPTKAALLQRFAEHLREGGWLYIGHSESLTRPHPLLELEGKTIYRRRA